MHFSYSVPAGARAYARNVLKMSKNDNIRINARIPASLKELMRKFVALDSHMSESEFVRDCIREKIQREAPTLYAQLFKEVGGE